MSVISSLFKGGRQSPAQPVTRCGSLKASTRHTSASTHHTSPPCSTVRTSLSLYLNTCISFMV